MHHTFMRNQQLRTINGISCKRILKLIQRSKVTCKLQRKKSYPIYIYKSFVRRLMVVPILDFTEELYMKYRKLSTFKKVNNMTIFFTKQ